MSMNQPDPKENPLPNEPERRVPVKPDEDPDPSKKREENDPTRIREPENDPTRIDEPPPAGPEQPPIKTVVGNKTKKPDRK